MAWIGWAKVEMVLAFLGARVIYLWGPPGTGKTHAAYFLGRTANGVYTVTLTQDTPASELRGHYIPSRGEFEWRDGVCTRAMRAGGRLVINELSHANADVQALLYPIIESEKTAQLELPTGEVVRPAPGFHIVITDNDPPDGLPGALADRLDCRIHIPEPHPNAFDGLPPKLRRAAKRTAMLTDDRRISPRAWHAINRLHALFTLADACIVVLGQERGAMVFDAMKLAPKSGDETDRRG